MTRPCLPAISSGIVSHPSKPRSSYRLAGERDNRVLFLFNGRRALKLFAMIPADEQARPIPHRGRLRQMAATSAAFAMYALRRFSADGCFAASGALSYTTLVSLVPLAIIALGSLSSFPIFAPVRDRLIQL